MFKFKVLEFADSLGYAGTERVMVTFCRFFDRSLFEPHVCAFSLGGPRERDLDAAGVDYFIANKSVEAVISYIDQHTIDVLHLHRSGHFIPEQYEIIRRAKAIRPDIIIIETNIFGKFDPIAFPLIDCSLSISKFMLNERFVKAAHFFDFSRMRVVYNPVDPSSFLERKPTNSEIISYRNEIGLKDADFVIGRIGRPHIAKWSDLILDMMPYLVRILPNVRLILQAAPISKCRIIRMSSYSDRVILLHETSDDRRVALLYSILDAYVHASKIGESFGLTLAEAGLFNVPVVVNSTPARDNNQVDLIDHMRTGIIANHPQTFARAIAYLAHNPEDRRRMGVAGYEKVLREYDPAATTRQLEKTIIDIFIRKGRSLPSGVVDFYRAIEYFPSQGDILAYKGEYKKRLRSNFGELGFGERLGNFLKKPINFYRKVVDFVDHRFS